MKSENYDMDIPAPLPDEDVPELKPTVVASAMVEPEVLPVFEVREFPQAAASGGLRAALLREL